MLESEVEAILINEYGYNRLEASRLIVEYIEVISITSKGS